MEVELFREIGMMGGKKVLRTIIASTTNQDLRDKDSSNFRTLTNFSSTRFALVVKSENEKR